MADSTGDSPQAATHQAPIKSPTNTNDPPSHLRIVLVGPGRQPFTLHTEFLTMSSKYFEAACKKEWATVSQTIPLPEIDPILFEMYVRWLHHFGYMDDDWGPFPIVALPGFDFPAGTYTTLIALYLMGTYLMDARFRNAIMTESRNKAPHSQSTYEEDSKLAVFAYENLPRTCTLCKFFCTWLAVSAGDWKDKDLNQNLVVMPKELLEDIVVQMAKIQSDPKRFVEVVHYEDED